MKSAPILALLSVVIFIVPARANVVPNPGFEESANGVVASWKVGDVSPPAAIPTTGSVAAKLNMEVSLGQTASDGHFLRFKSAGHADGDSGLVTSPSMRFIPGFKYEFSIRYRAKGLLMENADRTKLAALVCDLLFRAGPRDGNVRLVTSDSTDGWTTLKKIFTVPDGVTSGGIHLSVRNNYVDNPVSVDLDDITVEAEDVTLPNGGFEEGALDQPSGWQPVGGAQSHWVHDVAHGGKSAVTVADAPNGNVSGWQTEIPVRTDRLYAFDGWARTTDLSAQGFVGGAVLQIQFLDQDGQPLDKPTLTPALGAHADWTHVATPAVQAPPGAVTAQLTCGLNFTNGTAWFDDLNLTAQPVATREIAHVQRTPAPDPAARYAANLLKNGDLETGTGDQPEGWSYHGKSAMDWTPEEIARFDTQGRPLFNMGRAQGVWSRDTTYAGKGALVNISIDPPLSKNRQWYGRTPVDGYWLSDAMPCEAGKTYLASGWVRPGAPISEPWFGPLQLQFFGADGRPVIPDPEVRSSLDNLPANVWTYWATLPYLAPPGAVTMRLRFGQELSAQTGGWGRTYADNLAVWEAPSDMPVPNLVAIGGAPARFEEWFKSAITTVQPPYLPAPADAPAYVNVWGSMDNTAVGNLFYDKDAPVSSRISLQNLLGETRQVSLTVTRYDWLGKASDPITVDGVKLPGYGHANVPVVFPPSRTYGSYFVDIAVREGAAVVAQLSGRYAVLPKLDRPRTAENIWGVTPLVPMTGEDTPFTRELGQLLHTAGFGTAWVRFMYPIDDQARLDAALAKVMPVLDWYHKLGIQCIVQLHPTLHRDVPYQDYGKTAGLIATALKGKVRAFGNWGIEMANSASPFRGGGSERYGDDVYDSVVGAQYDGIKAATPDVPVYTGNIATDMEAKTLHRLYGAPCNGRFDGVVVNTYLGIGKVVQSAVKEFDSHNDAKKDVWMEESPYQASPHDGDARRYAEGGGAANMVRTWLGNYGANYPRLRLVTMWGFNNRTDEDINMVSSRLQPRPQFAAFAVLSDALADAQFVANRSSGDITGFEWKRGDGPFLVFWSEAGDRTLSLTSPTGKATVMDLMGNRREVAAVNGTITLELTRDPIYVFDGGALAIKPGGISAPPATAAASAP